MRRENRKKLNHFQVRVFMKLRKHKHARERKEEGKPDKRTGNNSVVSSSRQSIRLLSGRLRDHGPRGRPFNDVLGCTFESCQGLQILSLWRNGDTRQS